MDIAPVKKKGPGIPKNILTENTINQEPSSPRRDNVISQEFMGIADTTQTLFGRSFVDLAGVILRFFFYCDLRAMLALRLVSRGFRDLASIKATVNARYSCSPLIDKGAVSFDYTQFCNAARYPQLQKKSDFAKREKTEIHIKINVSDLIKKPEALRSIEQDRLKIVLQFENLNVIKQFKTWISNIPGPFIDKIKEFNFQRLSIAHANHVQQINGLLTFVAQQVDFLPNLTSISIGAIGNNNTQFYFSQDAKFLGSITRLSIGKISYSSLFCLPDTFSNLVSLSIGDIGMSGRPWGEYSEFEYLKLPQNLLNLIKLNIGNVGAGVVLKLPIPNNLENLSIGKIDDNAKLQLQLSKLNNIKYFSIGGKVFKFLPATFNNVTKLIIESIHRASTLPYSFEDFNIFSIDGEEYVNINLIGSLVNLKDLTIRKIKCNTTLELPSSLKKLTITKICSMATLTITTSLNNLDEIIIGKNKFDAKFDVSCVRIDSNYNFCSF